MRSKSIGFHEAAFEEAKAAYDWYASQNPAAAEGFIAELDDAIEQIGAFPDARVVISFRNTSSCVATIPFRRNLSRAKENR